MSDTRQHPDRSPQEAGRHEGERRKDAAHALLAAHRGLIVRRAQRHICQTLLDGAPTVTADDVRAAVELPPGIGPKLFGAAPAPLAKAGIIEPLGFTRTARPEAHARPLTVWGLRDRGKALDWLRDHPDRDDPPPDAAVQTNFLPINPNKTGAAAATAAPVN
jgi:hypothetical protein